MRVIKSLLLVFSVLLCCTMATADIPQWKLERYTTESRMISCGEEIPGEYRDYNVISNAMYVAEEYLWPVTIDCRVDNPPESCGEYRGLVRSPCSSGIECDEHLVEIATCRVEVTDCTFETPDGQFREPKVLKVYEMECLGTVDCKLEGYGSLACCHLPGELPNENKS